MARAPAREDHLAPRLDDRAIAEQNAGRGLSFKHHLVNPGRRPDRQVGAAFRLAQERFGGAATAAAAGRGLIEADALLPSPVEVFVVGNAGFLRGADKGPGQRMTIGPVRNRQLAVDTVILAAEPLVVLEHRGKPEGPFHSPSCGNPSAPRCRSPAASRGYRPSR